MSDRAGLVNRRFLLLVSGEALSIIGDQLTRIAAIWLILEIASNLAAVGFW
ncbi:MFS transporter, partial [Marinicauda algicola]